MFRVISHIAAAALVLGTAAGLSAANEPAGDAAKAAEQPAQQSKTMGMLFDGKHLKLTREGTQLNYRFQRSVSHEDILGQAFSDDISIGIEKNKEDDKRDFVFQIFTSERARDPFRDHDRIGNPLLLWYLDRSVNSYKSLSGGTLTYVKGRFLEALQKEDLQSEAIKVDIGGKSVDATRLTLTPYANDPSKNRMQGYENSRFILVVSDAVPGYFVELTSIFESTAKMSPRLEERISFVSEGEKK